MLFILSADKVVLNPLHLIGDIYALEKQGSKGSICFSMKCFNLELNSFFDFERVSLTVFKRG